MNVFFALAYIVINLFILFYITKSYYFNSNQIKQKTSKKVVKVKELNTTEENLQYAKYPIPINWEREKINNNTFDVIKQIFTKLVKSIVFESNYVVFI